MRKSNFRTDKKGRRSRFKGFSLVELIVIMAIASILVGLSGMALFSHMGKSDLKRAVRTVASLCRTARIEAIKRNSPVAFVVDNATDSFSVYIENGDGDWNTIPDNTLMRRFNLSDIRSKIDISGLTKSLFIFSANGRSSTPDGTIILKNEAGDSISIIVRNSGSVVTK